MNDQYSNESYHLKIARKNLAYIATCINIISICRNMDGLDTHTRRYALEKNRNFLQYRKARKCTGHVAFKFPLPGLQLAYEILMHLFFDV